MGNWDLSLFPSKRMESSEPALRPALAAALFKDRVLSLGAAARVSGTPLQDFMAYLTDLGINLVRPDDTTSHGCRLDRGCGA